MRLYKSYTKDVNVALKKVNLHLIDVTEELNDRDDEIREWLSRYPEVESYVILDDEDVFTEELKEHHILTSFYEGLLPKHVEKAVNILNKTV